MSAVACARFDDAVEELAIGHLDEPVRSELLTHAASCVRCRSQLELTAGLSDHLLLLAPEHEPPAGFETRVLDHIAAGRGPEHRRPRWWIGIAAAAALVAAVLGAMALGRGQPSSESAARSGVILTSAGTRVGEIELVRADHPYVVVTIDHPRAGGTEVYCELALADGRTTRVGSWGEEDVSANVWAVGITAEWLDAVRMRILAEDGSVLATATLA